MLKNVQRTQAQVMRARKEEWEGERETLREEKQTLKEEKKKLYVMFDLIKMCELDKEKLNKIRATCDE